MLLHHRPDVRAEHDQGELPARQVLLIADVLIGCHHYVETRLFRYFEKFAVFKLVRPAHFHDRMDFMRGEEGTRPNWNVFIEQDAQRDGS